MNKQIEERSNLALIVDTAIRDWQDRRYACNEEGLVEVKERLAESIAAAVLANGYRKQSEGEWIEDGYSDNPCVCSKCGAESQYVSKFHETFEYDWEENLQSAGYEEIRDYIRTPYCPECGAKMKGD